jgi:hypothetical protein
MRTLQADCSQSSVWLSYQAAAISLVLFLTSSAAHALELPQLLHRRDKCTRVAGLDWYTDYSTARCEARRDKKMLVVHFLPDANTTAQRELERWISRSSAIREQLGGYVLLRLPLDATTNGRRRGDCVLDEPTFEHLGRRPGIAILDFQHTDEPYYRTMVTALPFTDGKYYRWQNSHLAVALDLPPGTITQRTMVWAVRTHPESPASTTGDQHAALANAAAEQSAYQASIGLQGHHHWETRFHEVRAAVGSNEAREVVAESWPDQDLIDSCIDCVLSWRHSSGHWDAIASRHRLFGYDIRRGSNGIWYGTGIFAN